MGPSSDNPQASETQSPNNIDEGLVYKDDAVTHELQYKEYSVKVIDTGRFYYVGVVKTDTNMALPICLVSKEYFEEDLKYCTELPSPNNLPRELAKVIVKHLRSLSGVSEGGEEVVEEVKTSVEVSITIPEELEEIIQSERIKSAIPKIASILAEHIANQFNVKTVVVDDVVLGTYCYEGGAYVECSELVENTLYAYYNLYNLEEKGIRYKSLKTEFDEQLEDRTKVFRDFDHRLLLFKNGIFDWDRLERGEPPKVEFNPDYMIRHRINYEVNWSVLQDRACYEDLVKCIEVKTPFFRKVFQDWVGSKWILLYEVLGYTLYSKGYPLNKAVMLVGEGRNGKSTYLTLLKSILGSRNVKAIPLQELTKEKFAGSELYGVLANIYADLPNELLRHTGIFKILTGEDHVCFDKKYAKKRVCFTNYAKLIFSCNELPKVHDMTSAFWRRWIVIEFPNQFPDNPKFKEEVLKHPEIPNLIALSILAFKKVLERGKFSYQEEELDYREAWMRMTDPVYDFIRFMELNKLAVLDKDGRVLDNELYELYRTYHENRREVEDEILIKKTFTERLGTYGITKKVVKNKKYYVGIKLLKPPSEIMLELEGRGEQYEEDT